MESADPVLDALDRILASSDQLTARWQTDWAEDEVDAARLAYVETGAISAQLLDATISGELDEVRRIAEAIEQEFDSTDGQVLNWLQIGVIESIQHHASGGNDVDRHGVTPGTIKELLGPRTQASWEALDGSWGNSVDDV